MIITQTPLRVSFLGGGTDFPRFFQQQPGCVVTTAIDRYIFVIIKERFDDRIRIGYSKTELVDDIDDIQHDLVRECLRKTGIRKRVEIATMGDIPSSGSGMGSSSTVTVGLLNAMYQHQGQQCDAATLAREAAEIEIDILKKPIGVQDQYIAAYGGQRFISFTSEAGVQVERLAMDQNELRRLNGRLMLFYTNKTRQAETILQEQDRRIPQTTDVLAELSELAIQGRAALECGCLDEFGKRLDDAWQLKKRLSPLISSPYIDEVYAAAKRAGAIGGKIAGAGGGGFLLVYCRPECQDDVRSALYGLPEMPFSFERDGSKVIFHYTRRSAWLADAPLPPPGVLQFPQSIPGAESRPAE